MDKKRKILIIDDEIDLREMYADIFRSANYEVLEAGDGLEGLDIATKKVPDVIFTGIIMPRMDGFTMIESLRKIVMTSKIPVVISSHLGREEDKIRATELGAKDFIVKGFTKPSEILERIGSLFLESGDTYNLAFNYDAVDAPKLAKELSFSNHFMCLECGGKMQIKLRLVNPRDRVFEAQFFCPNCGWVAK